MANQTPSRQWTVLDLLDVSLASFGLGANNLNCIKTAGVGFHIVIDSVPPLQSASLCHHLIKALQDS